MHTYNKLIVVAMITLTLLAGCSQATVTPTTTSPPPTPAPVRVTVVATSTPTPTPADTASPVATADGLIAFVSDRDGNGEIYVMNTDGSGQTRLTNNPAVDASPSWSPR